ncbi:MAG: VWA domain-containing protein [Gammaproteobacteria bacterium]|nr:VWA domain-containing protein [Gammaproteobacteria bacterium]
MVEFDLLSLSEFHFLRPWWLLALIPLISSMLYLKGLNDPVSQWNKTIAPHILEALIVKAGQDRWVNPVNVAMLAIVIAIIALAGPSWQRAPSPFFEDEAVLVIGLDLSNTMNQSDIQPTRLERAKQKIKDLMALRGGAPTGLVVYAGSAHSVIPLTNDPDILYTFLSAVSSEMMPKPGKFPETILPLVDQLLKDSAVPGSVLLIGDGISPNSIAQFADYFDSVSHQLLVLGVGSEQAALAATDRFDGAHLALQSAELKALATAAGGHYQQLSIDKSDVGRINRRVNHHLTIVDDGTRPWLDAGYYLLYPFALIFLVMFRRGWTLHWCWVLVLIGTMQTPPLMAAQTTQSVTAPGSSQSSLWHWFMDLWLTPDQQGRYYFQQGDYELAAQHFRDSTWKGLAFYYDENFTAAVELFTQVETVDGLFNLANAQAQGQNYILAITAYDELLTRQPDHPGAVKNRAHVQKIIDEINLLSASQKAEQGEASQELGDAPQRADGADEMSLQKRQVKQLSAEQILTDQRMHDMWMRQIQQDPSRFLSSKFQMQFSRAQQSSKAQQPHE